MNNILCIKPVIRSLSLYLMLYTNVGCVVTELPSFGRSRRCRIFHFPNFLLQPLFHNDHHLLRSPKHYSLRRDTANPDLVFFFPVLLKSLPFMSFPTHFSFSMEVDDSSYSRWSYATSDARSGPMKRLPAQTSLGVWEDEDGVYYASNWPPVQEYLDLIRKERWLPHPRSSSC